MNANYMEKRNALRLSPRSGLKCAKSRAMNFDKIPNNSIKLDKFTGFFDKKMTRKYIVNNCNVMTYITNLSTDDSNLTAKFFQASHLPAFQVNWAGLPAYPRNCVDRLSPGCVRIFSGKDKHGWTRAIREMETGGLPLSEGGGISLAGNSSLEIPGVFSA